MILSIIEYPNPKLAERCEPVAGITDEIRTLADNMLETMYESDGIGLAAPQIGRQIRLVVIDVTGPEKREHPMVLVNPVLTPVEEAGLVESEEGCLSVPMQYRARVERPAQVRVQAMDLDGNPVEFLAEDLLAVCVQHEVDHLDGVLFLDRLSHLKRSMYDARLRKRARPRQDRGPFI